MGDKKDFKEEFKKISDKASDNVKKLIDKVKSYNYAEKIDSVKKFTSEKLKDVKNGKLNEKLSDLKKSASEKFEKIKETDFKTNIENAKGAVNSKVTELKTMDPKKQNKLLIRVIFVLIAFIFILLISRSCSKPRTVSKTGDGKYQLVEKANNVGNFNKLKITLKDPAEAQQIIANEIINGNIARKTYRTRDYVYRLSASKDKNANLSGYTYTWSGQINMDSICEDFREIRVIAHIAVENPQVIKAEWADNNIYYCMTVDALTSREAFLQEVNRVVIQNHEYDEKYAEENKDKVRESMESIIRQNAGQIPADIQKYIDDLKKQNSSKK